MSTAVTIDETDYYTDYYRYFLDVFENHRYIDDCFESLMHL